ncbi:PerC family transcriptional regulator [Escherichia coli]|uniref:PerC family transcriptional regulator n=1 Tax=Escherichia coli TaxID=562 RepID=UPI0039048EC6
MITDKKTEELEQRGLWRRAAARWQELLLNYLQEDDRICIQRRILSGMPSGNFCSAYGQIESLPCKHADGFSFMSAMAPVCYSCR